MQAKAIKQGLGSVVPPPANPSLLYKLEWQIDMGENRSQELNHPRRLPLTWSWISRSGEAGCKRALRAAAGSSASQVLDGVRLLQTSPAASEDSIVTSNAVGTDTRPAVRLA